MIRLFAANETTFDHYETVLTNVLSFESEEEENGIYFCEMTCPLDDRIEEGKILKAPTPRGEQLFRIIKVKKSLPAMTLYVYGRHISYDLLNNMVLDVRPTDTTQNNALAAILGGTEYAHGFTGSSDVPGLNTANYVRMNPVAAIMGSQDNSALNLWGGFLKRNNFTIQVLATSPDKGYEVRFGKNLLGADEELDMTEAVTRFYPTVVIEEPTVTALPEKYVDSPLINNYPYPIIREYRIELTDDEKLLPTASIYQLMRDRCNAQFALKADLPKVNYKIDFVELRKTEQYKDFAVLEELDISDTVWVYVNPLNLNMSARMIKYRHDGLHDRYLSMELGNFKPKLTNQKTEFIKLVNDATKELTDGTITAMLKDAVDRIQGNLGGNVVTITNNGKPVATAYMDTDDVNTANEYIIINNQGIAFGKNGLNNPPELAIDIDGSIVGQSAFFRSITTNLISSELGQNLDLSSNTSINLKVTEAIDNIQIGVNNLIKDANIVNAVGTMDKTRYLVDGTITHTNAQTTGGFYFTLTGLKPNKEYVLGFKATALSGALINMGGSNDSAWDVNEVYFDGVKQVGTWKSIHAFTGGEVMVKFTTSATVADSHRIYIQPNYNLTDTVTAKIEKLRMFDGHYLHSVWERNPDDPIKTLTVTVKSDGMYVDDGTSPVVARHTADGLRIIERSSGNNIATYTGDGSEVDFLRVNRISSMVVGTKMPWTRNVYVASTPTGDGTGRDASNKSSSVEVALKTALDGATDLQYNAQINVNIAGVVNEDVLIHGIGGMGVINLIGAYGTTQINGSIQIRDTTVPVKINGVTALGVDSSDLALIHASGLCNVQVENCRIDGANTKKGFGAYHGAILRIKKCPVVNCTVAYDASSMSQIFVYDTYGQGNVLLMFAQDMARIGVFYRKPNATTVSSVANGGEVIDTATATGSSFSVTPPVWKATTRTFSADLSSVNMASGYVWANGKWTQGTQDGASQKGVADFGLNIKTWLESAGGYQNISSVIIKARRNLSSGGSAPVSLKIGSPSAQTIPAVGYGATSQATLIAALVTAMTSGALRLESTTTATADYAAYDLVEIIVTAEKKA